MSCSITPRSSVIVRRCGASSEKSCGGNAAKNRLNLPCSNRRATGGVPYGIGLWLLLKGGDASPIKVRQKLPLPIVPCVQPIDPPVNESACKKGSKNPTGTVTKRP